MVKSLRQHQSDVLSIIQAKINQANKASISVEVSHELARWYMRLYTDLKDVRLTE